MTDFDAEILLNFLDSSNRVSYADLELIFYKNDQEVYHKRARGTALRNIGDKNNPNIGARLALGRALEKAGRSIQKDAWGQIGNADKAAQAKATKAVEGETRQSKPEQSKLHSIGEKPKRPALRRRSKRVE